MIDFYIIMTIVDLLSFIEYTFSANEPLLHLYLLRHPTLQWQCARSRKN